MPCVARFSRRRHYDGVKRLMERMVVIRPEVQRVLDQLGQVRVDIAPQFVTANALSLEPTR